jgi:hypothetical protein
MFLISKKIIYKQLKKISELLQINLAQDKK